LGQIFADSGLPPGVFNVVPGLGPLAGKALCSHPHVRKVDLTGGTATGRHVGAAAGANLAGVLTELGGKAPMLIFDDADIEQVSLFNQIYSDCSSQAVNGVAFATFVASGQTCIMGARVLVHRSVYERFMRALVAKVILSFSSLRSSLCCRLLRSVSETHFHWRLR
jgi:phenylacetaldehyde dehydrogenase